MSDIVPSAAPSFGGFIFGFIAIFTMLFSMWFYSGGPQKKDSDKAFITGPSEDYYKKPTVYGTINTVDKINRDINR